MAINFPDSPSISDTYVYNGKTWVYNGVAWEAVGGGNVAAASPFSADNRLLRSDGTGKAIQDSGVALDDTTFAMYPATNDVGTLGKSGNAWGDLFLASGGVINWNAGDVTLTHSADFLTLSGGSLTVNQSNSNTTSSLNATNSTDSANVRAFSIISNRATPTNNDTVYMSLFLEDSVGTQTEFARITGQATDVTDASEDGVLIFGVTTAGTYANEVRLDGTALSPVTNDGNALGTSSLGWSDLFLASGGVINFNAGDVTLTHSANTLAFAGASSGYSFSGGNVLIGDTTSRAFNGTTQPAVQVLGTDVATAGIGAIRYAASTGGSFLYLSKSRGAAVGTDTVVQALDQLGTILFSGYDGSSYLTAASIRSYVDGTPGVTDMPGGLQFLTRAAGAGGALTVRAQITAAGNVQPGANDGGALGVSGTAWSDLFLASGGVINFNAGDATITHSSNLISFGGAAVEVNYSGATAFAAISNGAADAAMFAYATSSSYTGICCNAASISAASASWTLYAGFSSTFGDLEYIVRGNGNASCDGAFTGGGADYAEYFEWEDGNANSEDRRGLCVVLSGDKVRPATAQDDPAHVIGAVSSNPSVVGDGGWNKWSGKYLRDEFGAYIMEDYQVTDDNGNFVTQQRRKLNPAYDPSIPYVSREDRPEWVTIGLMGKLRIRNGQPIHPRWIKMRDVSAAVAEYLVR
jgi:hypothetical protein